VLRDADFLKIGAAIFKFLSGTGVEASYYEEIYRMTIVDGLTGAYNKRYFLEFLEREIARCARYRRPLSLLMFDIDHFKAINDKHGHLTGDYVLRELSRRLLARVRREELLARYGGEEFAAVLPETDLNGARTFAEQHGLEGVLAEAEALDVAGRDDIRAARLAGHEAHLAEEVGCGQPRDPDLLLGDDLAAFGLDVGADLGGAGGHDVEPVPGGALA